MLRNPNRTVKKVTFEFDKGKPVSVLATNEEEEKLLKGVANVISGDRKKHGDIHGIVMSVGRDDKSSTLFAGNRGFLLGVLRHVAEEGVLLLKGEDE